MQPMHGLMLVALAGLQAGCTASAPGAERRHKTTERTLSSSMPPMVTANWKATGPAASGSAEARAPRKLELKRSDHVRQLLLRQDAPVPHPSCKPLLEADGKQRTLGELVRQQHAEADERKYDCYEKDDSGYRCNARFVGEEPEFLLEIDFEATEGSPAQVLLDTVRCTAAG